VEDRTPTDNTFLIGICKKRTKLAMRMATTPTRMATRQQQPTGAPHHDRSHDSQVHLWKLLKLLFAR
jgi:hypothetical protein